MRASEHHRGKHHTSDLFKRGSSCPCVPPEAFSRLAIPSVDFTPTHNGIIMTIQLRVRIAAALAAVFIVFAFSFVQQPGFFETMGLERFEPVTYFRFRMAESWGWVFLAEVLGVLTYGFLVERPGSERGSLERAALATTVVCTAFTVLAIVSAAMLPAMKGA